MKHINLEDGEEIVPYVNAAYYVGDYCSFKFSLAHGNCKHCYLDEMGYLITKLDNRPEIVEYMKNVFRANTKVTFGVNLTTMYGIDELKKHFTLVALSVIPTGYGNSYQYHAIFFTGVHVRDHDIYLRRFEKEQLNNNEKEVPQHKVLDIETVNKILSYKSKVWLKKYLIKLIS